MVQFWFGIFIIALAAALGWWGTQVASEGWKNWKHPVSARERAATDSNGLRNRPTIPEPIIRSYLEHPVMADESPPRINKKNPDAILHNDGAVSAVSVKVDLWVLSFQKDQVASAGSYGRSPHGHLFAVEELKPVQQVKESIPGVSGADIAAYVFDVTFNRKEDLRGYERRDIFFLEKGTIYTAGEFEARKDYKTLTLAINKFMNEKKDMPKTVFRGTNQRAWIADPDPRHDIELNKDGSALVRLRFSDIEQLKSHYHATDRPYLQLSPVRFKDFNTYLKAQFNQNTGTVKFVIEVANEGKEAAMNVRQDIPMKPQAPSSTSPLGTPETVSISPGERKFLTQEVSLRRVPSNLSDAAQDETSTRIDFKESPLSVKTTVYYSSKGDLQGQYRTAVTYELKENSVKLVSAEYE